MASALGGFGGKRPAGDMYGEYGSVTRGMGGGAYLQGAGVLLDDFAANPESKTGSVRFGGEERLPYVVERIARDSAAIVGNGDAGAVATSTVQSSALRYCL